MELGFGLDQCTEGQADNGGGRGRGEAEQWEGQEGGGAVGDGWALLQVCGVSVRVPDCRATVWVPLSLQGSHC